MAQPVPGWLGYDVASDRPLVKLVGGTKKLRTEDDASTPAAHAPSHENGGTDEIDVTGLSGELADPQPPKAHKTSHENAGSDEISVAGLSGVLADPQVADKIATSGTAVSISSTAPTTGQILVATSATAASWQTPSAGSGSTGNPYIDVPSSPNAFDDEFSSGSADLATRGYTIKLIGTATTLTRGGDINPWDVTGPTGNTYWSTIVGSFIMIQPPVNTGVSIFKAVSLTAGDTYFTRMGCPFKYDSTGTAKFTEMGFYQDASGNLDTANRIYVGAYEIASSPYMQMDMYRWNVGAGAGVSRNLFRDLDIRGVHYISASSNYHTFAVDSANGQSYTCAPAGGPNGANIAYVGYILSTGPGGETPTVFSIDYLRKKTSGAWIVP